MNKPSTSTPMLAAAPTPSRPLLRSSLLALLTALAACGGGGDGAAPVDPPAPPPAPVPAPGPSAAATPVGVAEGAALSASIGPAGGSLASPDGNLTVVVPPGAFAVPTMLTMQAIANHAHGGVGRGWRLAPHGELAAQPIRLIWRYAAEEAGAMAGLAVATQRADGTWAAQRAAVHDPVARTLTVSTRHFSDWSLVAGLQLHPGQAVVETGDRLPLQIRRCRTVNVSNDDAQIPLAACEVVGSAGFDGFAWAANGVAGGDAAQGRVMKPDEFLYPGIAAFVAPAAVPAANPVAVSARYSDPAFGTPITLVSNVRVVGTSSGCDWLRHVEAMDAEVEANYSWSGFNGPFDTQITHSASIGGRLVRRPGVGHIVHWQGPLASGQVTVNESRQLGSGSAAVLETETGSGAPFLGDAPATAPASLATVSVDLLRCKVWIGVHFEVDSQRFTMGLPSATPSQGGGGFAIGEYDIGVFRIVSGSRDIPAVGSGDFPDHYDPAGLNNALVVEQAGSAQVRWLFKPAP